MKYQILLSMLLSILDNSSFPQKLPDCIENLSKKTDLSNTKFKRVITLKGDRTAYEFLITSKRECIHCERGAIFYDGKCNVVAYFTMSKGSKGFVADGYTAAELGYPGYRNLTHGDKKPAVPACVSTAISNPDSLKKAGVIRVLQVRIKEKTLYCFEKAIDKKLANCVDCSKPMVFIDADCKTEVTFVIGGIAGSKGNNGYTGADYNSKRILNILWRAENNLQ